MSDSREDSPDWLRSFKAPAHSTLTISSGSDSSPNNSPFREENGDDKEHYFHECSQSPERNKNHDQIYSQSGSGSNDDETSRGNSSKRRLNMDNKHTPQKKKKIGKQSKKRGDEKVGDEVESKKHIESHATDPVWTLSSDSDTSFENKPSREQKAPVNDAILINESQESPSKKKALNKNSEKKSPKKVKVETSKEETKESDDEKNAEEKLSEKPTKPQVSSSLVPLLLSDKVNRSKVLVECDGDSIDLSGDMGAVGRVLISENAPGNNELFLDLKGTIYKTTIVPARTFCVVSFGSSEAKIESIMNDFIQLKPKSNVHEAETMVEGTLDGFSFDSEDEAEKKTKPISREPDQNEDNEEETKGKAKGKKKGKMPSKGKTQPAKRVKKKASVPKKTKAKK